MRDKTKSTSQNLSLHEKQVQIGRQTTAEPQNSDKVSQVGHRLILADEKIIQLKKRREKLQSQQALLFLKESQKIFNKEFSTDLALKLLKEAWRNAPEVKKKQEQKGPKAGSEELQDNSHSFRSSSSPSPQQEDTASQSTHPTC